MSIALSSTEIFSFTYVYVRFTPKFHRLLALATNKLRKLVRFMLYCKNIFILLQFGLIISQRILFLALLYFIYTLNLCAIFKEHLLTYYRQLLRQPQILLTHVREVRFIS